MKLLAIKDILIKMPVPWNDVVRKIGEDSLMYSHPFTQQIKDILANENRLIVLRKYKIKNVATINEVIDTNLLSYQM